jgi:hypothetical protein
LSLLQVVTVNGGYGYKHYGNQLSEEERKTWVERMKEAEKKKKKKKNADRKSNEDIG